MRKKCDLIMKKNFNRLKSVAVSGAMALTVLAAPFSTAVSPSLSASAADNDNYARLLQYSLYFYDANMCGECAGKTGMSWRSNCHMNDEVKGGFHDAGDHAMFGLPQGFTAATLGWSYYEFADAYQKTGQKDHLKLITDYFCEFFRNSTKLDGSGNVTNFLYQKGDGNEDHSYWGPPEQQGGRQMFWTQNGASDIAAEYAAALAVNYINFGNADDLKYAKALYKFSTQYNQCATYGPQGFYNSKVCADEQAWAAGWLYLATNENNYLNDLKGKLPEVGWVHGWNDAHLGAACLLGHATGDWSKATGYISSKANGGGYMFLDKWGSARLNCSMQFTALVVTKAGKGNYKDWAKGQMNYILGQNPANTCFVTGFASNSSKNVHHRAASGYTSYEQFNGNGWQDSKDHMNPFAQYSSNSHNLVGALAGGPCDAGGSYHDNMNDYVCNEVAIDYNAGLVGAAAGLYSMYGTGEIDTSIKDVTKIYKGSSDPVVTTTTGNNPVVTTTTKNNNPVVTTTTNSSSGNGTYTLDLGQDIDYSKLPDNDKMIGWEWSEFGIGSGETVTKVEVNISSSKNIGKWQGAFGSSTTVSPDYWTQTDEMSQTINGNKGTITWNVPADTAKIIQTQYGGELKFGIWWIDCQQFTVDSVKVYTSGGSSSQTTTTTTKTTTTTTKKAETTTTTTKKVENTTTTTTQQPQLQVKLYGDANNDGKVSIGDAVLVLQYCANQDKYGINGSAADRITPQGEKNADCYQPGSGVTPKDSLSIQKSLLGAINLPEN